MQNIVREIRYTTANLVEPGKACTHKVIYQCDLAGAEDAPVHVYDRSRKEWLPCGATKGVFSFDQLLWMGTDEAKAKLPDHGIFPPSGDLPVARYVEDARRKAHQAANPDAELPPFQVTIKIARDASRNAEAQQWLTLPVDTALINASASGTLADFADDLDEAESVGRIHNLRAALCAVWNTTVRRGGGSCCLETLREDTQLMDGPLDVWVRSATRSAKPAHKACLHALGLMHDMTDTEIKTALVNDRWGAWTQTRRGVK